MTIDHGLGIAYNREQEDDCVGAVVPRSSFQLGGKAAACLGGGYFFIAERKITMDDEIRKLIREYPEAADIPWPTKVDRRVPVTTTPEDRKAFLQALRETFDLEIPEDW